MTTMGFPSSKLSAPCSMMVLSNCSTHTCPPQNARLLCACFVTFRVAGSFYGFRPHTDQLFDGKLRSTTATVSQTRGNICREIKRST